MYKALHSAVLMAERALLFTLNFNLQAVTPYRSLRRAWLVFCETSDPECNAFWQRAHADARAVRSWPFILMSSFALRVALCPAPSLL